MELFAFDTLGGHNITGRYGCKQMTIQALLAFFRGLSWPVRVARLGLAVMLLASVPSVAHGVEEANRVALEHLLREFSEIPGLAAEFREEKRLRLLQKPLVSHGSLYYSPPSRLMRSVATPSPSRLIVDEKRIRYEALGAGETIEAQAHPAARTFVDCMLLLLNGDLEGLERIFAISYSNAVDEGSWSIRLEPRRGPLGRSIAHIDLTGRGPILRELLMTQRSGDTTWMEFSSVDSDRRFTEQELIDLFGFSEP